MPAYDTQFEIAKEKLTKLKEEPDNTVKLQIYALFKQVNGWTWQHYEASDLHTL